MCLEHSYCTIPNSHCKLAICHCDEGFIPTMQNTQCSGKTGLLRGVGEGLGQDRGCVLRTQLLYCT